MVVAFAANHLLRRASARLGPGRVHILNIEIAIDNHDRRGQGIEMAHKGTDGPVDPIDDLAEVALVLGGVGAGVELALDGGLGQHVGVGDERGDVALQQHQPLMNLVLIGGLVHLHGQIAVGEAGNVSDERAQPIVNAVDGIFHALMIAVTFDLHLLAEIAATDQAQNTVAFCDGQQNGVQHAVDAFDHSREIALEPVGLAALVQLTGLRKPWSGAEVRRLQPAG